MEKIKIHKIPNTALLFIIISPFTIFYYASYIYNPAHAGNISLYILQLIADTIAIISVGSLWLTIILDIVQPEHNRRTFHYHKDYIYSKQLTVDVLVPVAHEPISLITKTLQMAKAISYPHRTHVLDDGNSEEVHKIADELGISYISRPKHNKLYAKSGNINYGLSFTKGEFFAVFDADHVPKESFLDELLPFFENAKVALVQTPQHYTNTDKFIPSGTAQAQEIFYKYVQPAKNSYNASFCVGTNMIYRKSAIEGIGGIAKLDHSEDIWTTILIHEKGWETVYYNKVLAEGKAPETIDSYFRQQNRWARGGFTLFFQKNPLYIDKLTLDQRLQYLFSNVHYFSGFAILIYLAIPLIYLFTGQFSVNLKFGTVWALHYIPYALTIFLLPLYLLGELKLSTISTSMVSFVPYIQAFLATVLKNNYRWVATESRQRLAKPIMFQLWPLILFMGLAVGAILVGWYNPKDIITTLVTTIWTLFNMYIFFTFIKKGIMEELTK